MTETLETASGTSEGQTAWAQARPRFSTLFVRFVPRWRGPQPVGRAKEGTMSALVQGIGESAEVTSVERSLFAIAEAEAALADLLTHAERLHQANIQHDPISCLLCFESR